MPGGILPSPDADCLPFLVRLVQCRSRLSVSRGDCGGATSVRALAGAGRGPGLLGWRLRGGAGSPGWTCKSCCAAFWCNCNLHGARIESAARRDLAPHQRTPLRAWRFSASGEKAAQRSDSEMRTVRHGVRLHGARRACCRPARRAASGFSGRLRSAAPATEPLGCDNDLLSAYRSLRGSCDRESRFYQTAGL
jgi:hypothetical protein